MACFCVEDLEMEPKCCTKVLKIFAKKCYLPFIKICYTSKHLGKGFTGQNVFLRGLLQGNFLSNARKQIHFQKKIL